ncbi:MAG: sigma-70 family RNA polymerase sigma factor [Clostridia bacterium]|nr:sigma-70 family RNA polymerase sigma factor [Clostridia bacterium]
MEDREIVALYFARDEEAIACSRDKYGKMLYCIAVNLLRVREDAEETESDTYLTAWNKIPPDAPSLLGAYLSKITRYLCLNRRRAATAEKRPQILSAEEELIECIPSFDTPEKQLENGCLREALSKFLRTLKQEDRIVFLRRYFYGDSVAQIATRTGFKEAKIKTVLFRTRAKLKTLLEKEELL